MTVVEEQSLTEAGSEMMLSASAVSQSITDLERELDAQLMVRKRGQGMFVTDVGREVYRMSRDIAERVDALRRVSGDAAGQVAGTLRIGCFPTLSPWLFPPLVEALEKQYPKLKVHIAEGDSVDLQRRLVEGELDVALIYRAHLVAGVVGQEVSRSKLLLVVAADHPLAGRTSASLKEVAGERAILLDSQPSASRIEQLFREARVAPNVSWKSSNVETIRAMVGRGLGYAILMGRPFGDASYEGRGVRYLEIEDENDPAEIVAALPAGLRPAAKVSSVVQSLREHFSSSNPAMPAP